MLYSETMKFGNDTSVCSTEEVLSKLYKNYGARFNLSRAKHCGSLSGTRLMFGGSGAPCGAHAEDCLSGKPAVDSRRARVPQASGRRT